MVLGAVDLGGEIKVELLQSAFEEEEVDGVKLSSKEMWTELLINMCEMLARCWVLGEMQFVLGGGLYSEKLDEEDEKNLKAALDELGADFLQINPADALAAIIKRETQDEEFRGGLQVIMELFDEEAKRRGLSPEVKKRLTFGDLFGGDDDAKK